MELGVYELWSCSWNSDKWSQKRKTDRNHLVYLQLISVHSCSLITVNYDSLKLSPLSPHISRSVFGLWSRRAAPSPHSSLTLTHKLCRGRVRRPLFHRLLQDQVLLDPHLSPSSGLQTKCRILARLHWLHFSILEATSLRYPVCDCNTTSWTDKHISIFSPCNI